MARPDQRTVRESAVDRRDRAGPRGSQALARRAPRVGDAVYHPVGVRDEAGDDLCRDVVRQFREVLAPRLLCPLAVAFVTHQRAQVNEAGSHQAELLSSLGDAAARLGHGRRRIVELPDEDLNDRVVPASARHHRTSVPRTT